MKKISLIIVLSVLLLVASACTPKVPVVCGDKVLEVPLEKAADYQAVCNPLSSASAQDNTEDQNSSVQISENVKNTGNDSELTHLAYWTTATDKADWPDMSEFDIVECHGDPNENGDAKVVFIIGDISENDLQLTYFNGYSGTWNDSVKQQIIDEVQDSVRPHVPGFTLSTVEIIHNN